MTGTKIANRRDRQGLDLVGTTMNLDNGAKKRKNTGKGKGKSKSRLHWNTFPEICYSVVIGHSQRMLQIAFRR